MKKILFLFILLQTVLFANIFDHLKEIDSNKSCQTIEGIDFVYMINLDHRPDKFEYSLKELVTWGIRPYRFSAIYGQNLPLKVINDVGVKINSSRNQDLDLMGTYYTPEGPLHEKIINPVRTYFSDRLAKGPIAITLSHLSVIKDAYDSGFETIWVMEDDVKVHKNPHILSSYIKILDLLASKEGWDILFTDPDTKNKEGKTISCSFSAKRPDIDTKDQKKFQTKQIIHPDLRQVGCRYGAYSMIIRRSGMKKLLDFFREYPIFLPYDMDFLFPPEIKLFTVQEDIVSFRLDASSDNH